MSFLVIRHPAPIGRRIYQLLPLGRVDRKLCLGRRLQRFLPVHSGQIRLHRHHATRPWPTLESRYGAKPLRFQNALERLGRHLAETSHLPCPTLRQTAEAGLEKRMGAVSPTIACEVFVTHT